MIGPSGRVYLACGVTDMRRGIAGLSALVEAVIKEAPGSGAIFGFRGKRGQLSTFCIRFSFCDDRISLASAVREKGRSRGISAARA
ncbi:IS66 family insertion sequence element accessory protein TnpB [Sinorhizobium medicae]